MTHKLSWYHATAREIEEAIVSAIDDTGYDVSSTEVAQALDMSEFGVRNYLKDMSEKGKIAKTREVCHASMYDTVDKVESDD